MLLPEIISKHYPELHLNMIKRAMRFTADPEAAEEMVQQSFFKALEFYHAHGWQAQEGKKEKDRVSAWLCRIVDNLNKDETRKRQIRKTESRERLPDVFLEAPRFEYARDRELVQQCIACFPAPDREVFQLWLHMDLDTRATARERKTPLSQVRSQVQRLQSTLKLRLVGMPEGRLGR